MATGIYSTCAVILHDMLGPAVYKEVCFDREVKIGCQNRMSRVILGHETSLESQVQAL